MEKHNIEVIESLLLGIFFCLYKLTCAPNLSPFWCLFPVVGMTFLYHLFEFVRMEIADARSRDPKPKPYVASGGAIHWNPKTKSMYEDEEEAQQEDQVEEVET